MITIYPPSVPHHTAVSLISVALTNAEREKPQEADGRRKGDGMAAGGEGRSLWVGRRAALGTFYVKIKNAN